MAISRKLRRLAPWVLWLFLIAQFAAIAPLLRTDLQHAIEAEADIADDLAATGTLEHVHSHHAHQSGPQHDHTSTDKNDQCCTIQHHLGGVLPFTIAKKADDFPALTFSPEPSRDPSGTDPLGLDRPPKLPVSI